MNFTVEDRLLYMKQVSKLKKQVKSRKSSERGEDSSSFMTSLSSSQRSNAQTQTIHWTKPDKAVSIDLQLATPMFLNYPSISLQAAKALTVLRIPTYKPTVDDEASA